MKPYLDTLESECKRPRARGKSQPGREREHYIQRNPNVQKSGQQETEAHIFIVLRERTIVSEVSVW